MPKLTLGHAYQKGDLQEIVRRRLEALQAQREKYYNVVFADDPKKGIEAHHALNDVRYIAACWIRRFLQTLFGFFQTAHSDARKSLIKRIVQNVRKELDCALCKTLWRIPCGLRLCLGWIWSSKDHTIS